MNERAPRHIEITLEQREVSGVARLLDDRAPRTCAAIWEALPQSGPAYHGKYARNEIYTWSRISPTCRRGPSTPR